MRTDIIAQLSARLAAMQKERLENATAMTNNMKELAARECESANRVEGVVGVLCSMVTQLRDHMTQSEERVEKRLTEMVNRVTHLEECFSRAVTRVDSNFKICERMDAKLEDKVSGLSLFSSDPVIVTNLSNGFTTLRQWTGKNRATIVFDTDKDGWDHGQFIDALKQPSNAVIGITEDGDVFGAFVSVAINETDQELPDEGQFVFSLFSHGRCKVPRRWGLRKDRKWPGKEVKIYDPTDSAFIGFGSDGHFWFGNGPNESDVFYPSRSFEGIGDNVLTGEDGWAHFTTVRLLVVRLW